ncbi:hypothetical protein HPB48_003780 [Haemaphysalis longicornis]|uniref:Uncharacterized protein n=1 Tax=Haemaphysalis longicornis TaxID=44386 RepID=A0A9J6FFP5_HAELO|nr:hypothetical protein HPB48_003780 [Haemaphysalis longicornis]
MAPKYVQDKDGWNHPVLHSASPAPQLQATLVLHPGDYLNLSKYDPCTLHAVLRNKASLTPAEAAKFMVRVDNVKNLAFLLCLDSDISKQLQLISSIDLEDRPCHVTIYPATPSNTCKGVVHNIPAGTSPDHLMRHMSTLLQGTKILAARMMGRTATAIITFESTHPKLAIVLTSALTNPAVRPAAKYCPKTLTTPAQQIRSASAAGVPIALTTPHVLTGKPRMQPFARQPRLHVFLQTLRTTALRSTTAVIKLPR